MLLQGKCDLKKKKKKIIINISTRKNNRKNILEKPLTFFSNKNVLKAFQINKHCWLFHLEESVP